MFSAFKRLASKNDASNTNSGMGTRPPGHQAMSTLLQRKFARGVQYNMKIVIKGDRNVGKTCLFHRLQGKKFVEEYLPTDEIQVTSIQWNYKATDDVVKVEVWDVVDRGKKKKRFEGLKLENLQMEMPEEAALDAEFLDVYKGTNGVIIMMDLTKTWTFDYIQREIPKIPGHIPVIILANHCDMAHHRTVTSDHVTFYIESIAGTRPAQIRYSESSMRNGFGLKLLHKFFNLPFLQLQKETLMRQLERNEIEINATIQELDMFADSDEANYNKFLDNLVKRRREVADSNANLAPSVIRSSASTQQLATHPPSQAQTESANNNNNGNMKRSQSVGPIVIGAGQPIPYGNRQQTVTNNSNSTTVFKKNNTVQQSQSQSRSSSSQSSGFISKFGVDQKIQGEVVPDLRRLEISPITSVEEFCPDGGQLDRSFLDDVQYNSQNSSGRVDHHDSDSDTDTGNPLVSELQEDFDPEDVAGSSSNPGKFKMAKPTNQAVFGIPSDKDDRLTGPDDYDVMKQTNDEFDSTINSEISELTSDAYDAWMGSDTKWRRSPEGGEDVSAVSQTLDYSNSTPYDDSTSVTSSNVQMELLSSKHSPGSVNNSVDNSDDDENTQTSSSVKKDKEKDREKKKKKDKETDKKKSKAKHKDKDSKHKDGGKGDRDKDKKHKRRSRDESHSHRDELEEFLNGSSSPPIDAAYEAI